MKITPAHTNRLAGEKSPYLLQHAHNPVDWFPWGDDAFAKAHAEQKPIFLSIGYSTCHWCHVMERESFENEPVARYLNGHFVSIKVDREERPDLDKIYLTFVQATTGSGGWPLNVFLTPGRKPFFGGTYFPSDNRFGRASFLQILEQIEKIWRERHDEVAASADEIQARLEAAAASAIGVNPAGAGLTADTLRNAAARFKAAYDPRHGGFGGAPKFPQPSQPAFLLRVARREGDDEAARMVLHTCDRMAAGGIHDQLGGGFARYAVDAEWLVPHFEKMLYDNAQLVQLYLDAYLVSGERRQADVARDILAYVLRDMTHPDGGFYSAEDADSEGQEGRFYCWTRDDLSKLLSPEEFNVAARYFGITDRGNFVDHSHPQPLSGQNVLSIVEPLSRPPATRPPSAVERDGVRGPSGANDPDLLASAKQKMLAARNQRVRPHLDDKILASWNGLMLGALARGYAVLGDEDYRAAAEKNLAFIQAQLWKPPAENRSGVALPLARALPPGEKGNLPPTHEDQAMADRRTDAGTVPPGRRQVPSPAKQDPGEKPGVVGTLFHRWRDGERDDVQLLAGYAFLLAGVIDLYEATLDPKHLDFAIALAEAMIARFYDAANGGFWQTTADAKDLILRVKDDYDGAEPSGNSVATLALLKLAAISGRQEFHEAAEATLRWFAARLEKIPQTLSCLLHALDFWIAGPRRVIVATAPPSLRFGAAGPRPAKALALLHAAHSVYQPNKVVLGNAGSVEPFARALPAVDDPVVYVCSGNACQAPTRDAAKVKDSLSQDT